MPAPIASVIIPNYNGKHLLAVCLPALRRQTYPAGWFEVIVVDDASSDGTTDFLADDFPEVRVVALERNSGFIAACNAGVAAARGAVLVLLNNDTEAEPGWLEALIAALEKNPRAGSAASKMLLFDRRDHLHTTGDMMGVDGIPRNRGVWERDDGQYDGQRQVFGACGGAAAYRRQAWEQAGGFDPALFMYMEDVDLAWRLQLLGWQAVYVPDARVYHQVSATGGGVLASYYVGRNTILVIARNWPGALLRRHWRSILSAQLRIAAAALRNWRGAAARARLRGQLAGLLGIPGALAARRRIQPGRRVSVQSVESLLT
ncbi:MAG: glycosyltransferase family 2 protein [Anaerolineae bacterium]|nr:glycosyltransferase family 2 protein [Anaerolineae bacterium]